jgi:hypothetical protein
MKPGSLVSLRENPKYSGVVLNRELLKDSYKDSGGQEPWYILTVLWNTDHIPLGEVGTLGIGEGPIKQILEDLEDLVEVV